MLEEAWTFIKDPANEIVLIWICGGISAFAAGVWTVVKFFAKKPSGDGGKPTVSAERGGFAAGRDISNVNINGGSGKANRKKGRKSKT